jgi:hypothetical protein
MTGIMINQTSLLFQNFGQISHFDQILVIIGYIFLLATSGYVVFYSLKRITKAELKIERNVLDTGFIIGKCENILILTFFLLDAYTALGLIFTAKGFLRRDDIRKDPLYFLAGTMINFTYSIVIGILLKILLSTI